MELSAKQQAVRLLRDHSRILILTATHASVDAAASALALWQTLKKLGKDADLICPDHNLADISFLSGWKDRVAEPRQSGEFVVSIDLGADNPPNISYAQQGSALNLYVKQSAPRLTPERVSVKGYALPYTLILTLQCPDFDQLGNIFEQHPTFFYETSLINIDNSAANSHYGSVALLDHTVSSTAELVLPLVEELRGPNWDPAVATSLLTALIAATDSFRSVRTTPRSFTTAAQLIGAGAERGTIIHHLYKSKSFEHLKVWGQILGKLGHRPESALAWAYLPGANIAEQPIATQSLCQELLFPLPEVKALLVWSDAGADKIKGLILTQPPLDARALGTTLHAKGTKDSVIFETIKPPTPEALISKILQK